MDFIYCCLHCGGEYVGTINDEEKMFSIVCDDCGKKIFVKAHLSVDHVVGGTAEEVGK